MRMRVPTATWQADLNFSGVQKIRDSTRKDPKDLKTTWAGFVYASSCRSSFGQAPAEINCSLTIQSMHSESAIVHSANGPRGMNLFLPRCGYSLLSDAKRQQEQRLKVFCPSDLG